MGNLVRAVVVGVFVVSLAASAQTPQQPPYQPGPAGGWVKPLPPIDAGPTRQPTNETSRSQPVEPHMSEEELSALVSDNPETAEAAKPIGLFCANLWSDEMYTVCDSSRERCNVRRRGAALLAEYWSVGACEPVYQAHPGSRTTQARTTSTRCALSEKRVTARRLSRLARPTTTKTWAAAYEAVFAARHASNAPRRAARMNPLALRPEATAPSAGAVVRAATHASRARSGATSSLVIHAPADRAAIQERRAPRARHAQASVMKSELNSARRLAPTDRIVPLASPLQRLPGPGRWSQRSRQPSQAAS